VAALAVGMFLPAVVACGSGNAGGPATLNWYTADEHSEAFPDAAAECSRASAGSYQIKINLLPNESDGQRQQMARRLAARDSSLDILGLDVTWTAEFAEAGWIAPIIGPARDSVTTDTLRIPLDTGTWKNQLYAAPLNTNTQLLWYRRDLVPNPPRTWNEMIQQAKRLAADGKPHSVEVQGAPYEGYTVLFNTLVASAGGRILTADNARTELGAPAEAAIQALSLLAHSPAADPSWGNQHEDDNRLAFENGDAAFQLNYPFVYASAKKNHPDQLANMGWTQYPALVPGQPSHVTIGGTNLAVSAYSRHPRDAVDAIICLRSRDNQIRNAVAGGLPPTRESIYQDPAFINSGAYPFADAIYEALTNASVRPKTPAYQSVSLQIAHTLSPPSSVSLGKLHALRNSIDDALTSKGLVP
jgi:multiple sugar transport system substrate-binding protein